MRIKPLLFLLIAGLCCYTLPANAKRLSKIVLDAGHGGKDIGARGQYSMEKDLTLAVVKRVGKLMNDSMRDVQVLYTRTVDEYPELKERHEIANKANADLFVAVHVNSTADRIERIPAGTHTVKKGRKKVKQTTYRTVRHHITAANGVETYVLGLKRNSQKESAIGEYGEMIADEPGLLNENDPQTAIIIAQYAQAFLGRSVTLGTYIQRAFAVQGRADLGVKQMSLEVLAGSAMPGVLVEIGFINNPEEEAYLNSDQGQREVAYAIYKGIRAYKAEIESR